MSFLTSVSEDNDKAGHVKSGGENWRALNRLIAGNLLEFAALLEQQGADGFRENAYRNAADTVEKLDESIAVILAREGREGLIALPAIGKSIAAAIAELLTTGRWAQLDRLSGDLVPEKLFMTIPGIGPVLAEKLAENAHLETLEDLEAAIHSGDKIIKGLGPRRKQAIAAILSERLGRPVVSYSQPPSSKPTVEILLKVDQLYRERAAAGKLRKIAPKRFNPSNEQWLPIMHSRHDEWHFTALFSNTRLAHELGKTTDWVVIFYHQDDLPEGRCTVVTETRGPQKGQRVVRGREKEA